MKLKRHAKILELIDKYDIETQEELAELLNAEIKAEAYNELINVAEAKFGIQIRKIRDY